LICPIIPFFCLHRGFPMQGEAVGRRNRRAEFICTAPTDVVDDVAAKVQALIAGED